MLLLLSAFLLGLGAGILLAVGTLLRHTQACEDDCANHLHAACELSAKLAEERQKNEHLTTQVDGFLSASGHTDLRDIQHISL